VIEVQTVDRKSPVLTPSSLACLREVATINLTAGCVHDCVYCYIRGYRNHPGESRVALYANTVEGLRSELGRKRTALTAVYFSPSSDLFQPVPQVLEMAYQVLYLLLERGIPVTFLTKGVIPKKHMRLLAEHASLVWAEIGLISLDDAVRRLFEPAAASVNRRLKQIGDLIRFGVNTEVRVDPIIPGFTDDESSLRELIAAIASRGVKSIAASTLFLRPAITASLRKNLARSQFTQLMAALSATDRMDIHAGNSSVHAMSAARRRRIYDRVQSIAAEFGIKANICACKNPDLANGSCGIAGQWRPSTAIGLPLLFQ
jgi:DNA repair photolyase